jgi:hypothetical protein
VQITVTNIGSETISFGSGFTVWDEDWNEVVNARYRHLDTISPNESLTYTWGIGPNAQGYEWKEYKGDYRGIYHILSGCRNCTDVVQYPYTVFIV